MNISDPKISFCRFLCQSLCILGLFCFKSTTAQVSITSHPDIYYRIEPLVLNNPQSHEVIKPVVFQFNQSLLLIDSVFGKSKDVKYVEHGIFRARFNPILQSTYRIDHGLFQHQAFGLQTQGELGSHFSFEFRYAPHVLSRKPFEQSRLDSANLVYHYGYAKRINDANYVFNEFNLRLSYTPNQYLTFTIGKDKNFFGDGYHSFFLSDNAPSYPFFITSLTIWKIKYVNQVMLMKDFLIGNNYSSLLPKYASMHILSWDVTKRINLNLFEAVIWRSDDTVGHQKIDINYINPFAIYRPIEYTLGSPDNVLVGFGSRFKILSNSYLYGQFLLDEFYLKEILNGRGWWADKNALQIGLKSFDFLKLQNLYFQIEYNQSRPFTFAHDYPIQNYGYLLQPLANPLGTNFRESLVIVRYAKNRWQLSSFFSYVKSGTEPGGKTIGADIYISSKDRFYYNTSDDGNFIGQGIATKQYIQKIKLTRILNPRWGLAAEAGFENSTVVTTTTKQYTYFTFGIKTLLNRDEKLF